MSTASNLGKASGFFFISGFVTAKAQNLPIPVLSSALNIISLLFYITGYALWFIGSHFYPEHAIEKDEWYGFAQFKEQYLFAATLGLIATSFSVAAFFAPPLLIPATWLFLASNILWTTGEYHKLSSPPLNDENYSHSYQKVYSSYATTMTSISAVTALAATLSFLFPPIALSVIILSTIINVGLGALVAELWLNHTFGGHKPTPIIQSSHNQMNNALGPKVIYEEINSPAPFHDYNRNLPRTSGNNHSPGPELDDNLPEEQTCSWSC